MINAHKILVWNIEGKTPRHSWEDNIKIDLGEVRNEDVELMEIE
jgi:hypothetical protein